MAEAPSYCSVLHGDRGTRALGEALAHYVRNEPDEAPLLLTLSGPLGAGKSALARALLRALGVQGTVRSPTYTLLEPYELADGTQLRHLDLYRLADPEELEFIGYFDDIKHTRLTLVEWPERAPSVLDGADLQIELAHGADAHQRRVQLRAQGPSGRAWLRALQDRDLGSTSL